MKKILIAVDDSKGSLPITEKFGDIFSVIKLDEVAILYVERAEGGVLMDETMSDTELEALKEALKGTEYQAALDRKAAGILNFYEKALSEKGVKGIKKIVREGHPADEILDVAKEEGSELIVVGTRGRRLQAFLMGSVSSEVAHRADVPVLIVK